MDTSTNQEIILECIQLGKIIRVLAVDVKTGIEVVFQAPSNTAPTTIKRIAAKKLGYVLRKQEINGRHS